MDENRTGGSAWVESTRFEQGLPRGEVLVADADVDAVVEASHAALDR